MLAILNFFTAINESAFPNKQKQISFPSGMNESLEGSVDSACKCALLRSPVFNYCLFLPLTYCSVQSINTMPASQVRTLL